MSPWPYCGRSWPSTRAMPSTPFHIWFLSWLLGTSAGRWFRAAWFCCVKDKRGEGGVSSSLPVLPGQGSAHLHLASSWCSQGGRKEVCTESYVSVSMLAASLGCREEGQRDARRHPPPTPLPSHPPPPPPSGSDSPTHHCLSRLGAGGGGTLAMLRTETAVSGE